MALSWVRHFRALWPEQRNQRGWLPVSNKTLQKLARRNILPFYLCTSFNTNLQISPRPPFCTLCLRRRCELSHLQVKLYLLSGVHSHPNHQGTWYWDTHNDQRGIENVKLGFPCLLRMFSCLAWGKSGDCPNMQQLNSTIWLALCLACAQQNETAVLECRVNYPQPAKQSLNDKLRMLVLISELKRNLEPNNSANCIEGKIQKT